MSCYLARSIKKPVLLNIICGKIWSGCERDNNHVHNNKETNNLQKMYIIKGKAFRYNNLEVAGLIIS